MPRTKTNTTKKTTTTSKKTSTKTPRKDNVKLTKQLPTKEECISVLVNLNNTSQLWRKEQGKSYVLTSKEIANIFLNNIVDPEKIKPLLIGVYTLKQLQDELYQFTSVYNRVKRMTNQEIQNKVEYTTWVDILANGIHPTDLPKQDRK